MNENISLSLTSQPAEADRQFIRDGLYSFNVVHAGPDNYLPLDIHIHDADGSLAGGLIGCTAWRWLYVEILWIREDLRGQGLGKRILAMAEEEAIRRGCIHANLDTVDFQAPDFYQQQGYEVWGRLDDGMNGHQRIFLKKDLVPSAVEQTGTE